MSFATPDWAPFRVAPSGQKGDLPRSLPTLEGIGDRLRSAGFAELQAREAFLWAAHEFCDQAPPGLCDAWKALAAQEDKHLGWLLTRLSELGLTIEERLVSDQLWLSLRACTQARQFALYMAQAEERGRRAGERFHEQLLAIDPVTAKIFGQIALEEREHIALAERFYPTAPLPPRTPKSLFAPRG